MNDTYQPKRLTGALVSGVVYLDEQGQVQDVHWCMSPDGDDAPADVQPVIRLGGFDATGQILPEMLSELADRFAQAAATEAAKAARSKKKAAPNKPAPTPTVSQAAVIEDALEEESVNQESEAPPAETIEEHVQPETPSGKEQTEAKPAIKPAATRPAVSNPSLFDGLDMS
jgi:hypothetical protein